MLARLTLLLCALYLSTLAIGYVLVSVANVIVDKYFMYDIFDD